jgi:hypothetical protein
VGLRRAHYTQMAGSVTWISPVRAAVGEAAAM